MNRKRYLLWVFLMIASLQSLAQDIRMSSEMSYRSDELYAIIGQLQDTILLFKEKSYNYSVDVLNKDLEHLITKELFFEKEKIRFNAIIAGDKDFVIIYSYDSKFRMHMRARRYDIRGNMLDSITLYKEKEIFNEDPFSFVLSDDEQSVVLFREHKYNSLEMLLFDISGFNIRWKEEITFEDYRMKYDLMGLLLTNDQDLVLAFEDDNQYMKRSRHKQELYFLNPEKELLVKRGIAIQGKLSVSFNFVVDERNQEVICAGLYGEKSESKAEGYYLYKVKSDEISHNITFHPFSRELLMEQRGRSRKVKKFIPDLILKDIVVRNDGGMLLITEMQKELARQNVRRRYIDYHYEDIIVFAVHPEGDLFWDDLIRKYQLSYDDGGMYSSYFLFKTPSELKIIFNDEIKTENTISEYSFNPLGKGNRKSLFATDLHLLKLVLRDARQISPKTYLIPSLYNSRFRIVKVAY